MQLNIGRITNTQFSAINRYQLLALIFCTKCNVMDNILETATRKYGANKGRLKSSF